MVISQRYTGKSVTEQVGVMIYTYGTRTKSAYANRGTVCNRVDKSCYHFSVAISLSINSHYNVTILVRGWTFRPLTYFTYNMVLVFYRPIA